MGHFVRSDGRTIIVAMDHGSFMGPLKGIDKPADIIEKMTKGGADAVILTSGLAEKVVDAISGRLGLILRLDGIPTLISRPYLDKLEFYLMTRVKDAVILGADAVIATFYIGSRREAENLANISIIARECYEYGVPLIVEVFPVEPGGKDPKDPEILSVGTRTAYEIGADMIKTYYTGDPESFRELVRRTGIPIVILGGPKRKSTAEVLKDVKNAISAGAAGIAFGRNIWQYENPEAMVRALVKIIHEDSSVEDALAVLGVRQ